MSPSEALITTLKSRFLAHPNRHVGVDWGDVERRLNALQPKLSALALMEQSGGEPDVIGAADQLGAFTFFDCSPESPAGRRSLCFDREALDKRKENKPAGNALDMAASFGAEILDETAYRQLQTLGNFDLKTSSWIQTPAAIRKPGGALFCDRRYDTVFTYHNGAESYYAARGFRVKLVV
jgi:Protein of unknown function (DUF4256)